MIFKLNSLLFVVLCLILSSCSAHSKSDASGTAPLGANAAGTSASSATATLPASWVNLKDAKAGGGALYSSLAPVKSEVEDPVEMPDAKTDGAVQNAFKANVSALTQVNDVQALSAMSATSKHPSDWTPWHLDGMVGYYAVSQGGLIGALLYSGTESIKLTWQKVSTPAPVAAPSATPVSTAQKLPSLKVTPNMQASDLPTALEPSVQVALASGAIQNENAFRTNLLAHAQTFYNVAQVLSAIPRNSEWYVDGYQLNLSFSASGEVTPVIGVGGAVNLYFDWSRTTDPTVPASTAKLASEPQSMSAQLKNFVQLISTEIPQAVIESKSVQQDGFNLDMIQVGLGISASGDIAVAQASVGSIGRVIFKRDITVATQAASSSGTDQLSFMPPAATSAPAGVVYQVNNRKFRNSLKHAIKMANYFAARAKNAENAKFKLNQIESEFDLSLGGDLKLAVVNGIGQFVLDFDFIK